MTSLKKKTTKGVIWNGLDRLSMMFGHLIIGIILARLLVPEDFGIIGVLSIFISISQVFIEGGMASGLIQTQDVREVDFSTVFVFNMLVSILFYLLLFFTAPLIARFYDNSDLVIYVRVIALNLIINAFAVVQRVRLEIKVDFKTIAKINIISLFIAGGIAILMAFYDFGVWVLIMQTLLTSLFMVLGLWFNGDWKFSLNFSRKSFKKQFAYGSKLLIAGVYSNIFQEVYNVVIGKKFSIFQLGFYTQAKKISDASAATLTGVLQKVTFPVLSSLQNDEERMINIYRRIIGITAFVTFPTMALIALLAEPIVLLLFGEKWIKVTPLLRWLSISRMTFPIGAINMNILNAKGRSDLFLKVDLFKIPFIIIALIITIPISIEAVLIGHTIVSFISFFINAYMPGKLLGYGALKQLRDMFPMILSTILMSGLVYVVVLFIESMPAKVMLGSFVAIIIYFTASYSFKIKELQELKSLIKNILKK